MLNYRRVVSWWFQSISKILFQIVTPMRTTAHHIDHLRKILFNLKWFPQVGLENKNWLKATTLQWTVDSLTHHLRHKDPLLVSSIKHGPVKGSSALDSLNLVMSPFGQMGVVVMSHRPHDRPSNMSMWVSLLNAKIACNIPYNPANISTLSETKIPMEDPHFSWGNYIFKSSKGPFSIAMFLYRDVNNLPKPEARRCWRSSAWDLRHGHLGPRRRKVSSVGRGFFFVGENYFGEPLIQGMATSNLAFWR